MKPPKISVVIPSYNKVRFIGQTLNSIIIQKYSDLEVIIQDGGSTDGTLEIIRRYAKKYPEMIKWESKKDKGQLDAINIGMDKAKGKILTFINADDVYESGAFNTIAKAYMEDPDALWFAGRGRVINEKDREIAKGATWYKNLFLVFNSYFFLLTLNYLMQPSVFITRQAWQKFGPFVGTSNFVMEYELWLNLATMSMPVVIDKNLSYFRLSGDNISSTLFKNTLNEDLKIVKKYTQNPLILLGHRINNWGRVLMINFLRR